MNKLKQAIIQAIVIAVVGSIVAFTHNAFSVNGINPFRKIKDVPVIRDEAHVIAEGISIIDIEKARAIVEAAGLVIDARTAAEYAEGHLPGALLVDYYDMGRYLDAVLLLLSPEYEIMLYCAGMDCEDSELLARELFMMGYKKLAVFRGGYEEWIEAGLPIEQQVE